MAPPGAVDYSVETCLSFSADRGVCATGHVRHGAPRSRRASALVPARTNWGTVRCKRCDARLIYNVVRGGARGRYDCSTWLNRLTDRVLCDLT